MQRPQRTWLVATDFSPAAAAALSLAWRDLAALGGGRLLVCHIAGVLEPAGAEAVTPEQQHARAVEAVRKTLPAGVATDPGVTIDFCSRRATPADGILAEVKQSGAERIVIGSHGRKGVEHFLMGSVASTVARLASVPVLVVKP
jgi:nucleotide-binding universal stress UspA family protein